MYDVVVMDNLMHVILTGQALHDDIADYIAHGADSVLKKPLDMAEFFAAVLPARS